jgi:hypothetical protein
MTAVESLKSLFAVALLVAAGGCGDPGDDGTVGAFATQPGKSVAVAGLASATLTSRGGGLPAPRPAGAACEPRVWSYTLDLEGSSVSWSQCRVEGDSQDPASFKVDNGSRPLAASEQGGAETALRGVRVSARTSCGADKDYWELAMASAGGTITYGDDFYACLPNFEHFVEYEGLERLYTVLWQLASQ